MQDPQKQERIRAKFIPFSVRLPITKVVKNGEMFSTETAGEITLEGRGRIDPSKANDLPAEFAAAGWLTIDLTKAEYCGADLLPILTGLPHARSLRESLENYAHTQVALIYNAQFAK